jgi:hypothetical protein
LLTQYSDTLGKQQIYITKTAVKVNNLKQNITVLLKSPYSKIYVLNRKTKMFYITDEKHWRGPYTTSLYGIFSSRMANLPVVSQTTGPMYGLPAQKLNLKADVEKIPESDRNQNVLQAAYWVTDSFHLPPAACRAVARYYELPVSDQFPLRLDWDSRQHNKHNELNTETCEQQSIDNSIFLIPEDYKQTESESDVLINAVNTKGMIDLIKVFGKRH